LVSFWNGSFQSIYEKKGNKKGWRNGGLIVVIQKVIVLFSKNLILFPPNIEKNMYFLKLTMFCDFFWVHNIKQLLDIFSLQLLLRYMCKQINKDEKINWKTFRFFQLASNICKWKNIVGMNGNMCDTHGIQWEKIRNFLE
jgi:hypothetical protein